MVEGITKSTPSAIFRNNLRRIFPERVFGKRLTTNTLFKDATGPIIFLTSCTMLCSNSKLET